MKILAVLILTALPSAVLAAYQDPTVVSNQRQANGTVLVTFAFTGDAGEPPVTRGYVVSKGTTAVAIRNWVDDTIKELDLVRKAETIPALQPEQIVTRLPRSTSTLTAKQIWNEKFARYKYYDSDLTGSAAAERAALKADLEATHEDGFLAQ